MAHQIQIQKHPIPHVFLDIDVEDFKDTSVPQTVMTVSIKGKDGKIARCSLAVGVSDLNGPSATMNVQRANSDTARALKMAFIDDVTPE